MSVPMNSNRELENAFKQIITAGWAMKSDGNVEAPCGYFAKIPIAPNELSELLDAVFDGEHPGEEVNIEPGYYFTKEDSAGNIWIWKFGSQFQMDAFYRIYERQYEEWAKPKYSLQCNGCLLSFEDIQEAHEHGASDPNTKAWCGDNGFIIKVEGNEI